MLARALIVYSICCLLIFHINADRNSNSEAICAPFLTGQTTTPLIPSNKRNLTIDEDAEFECELVLQDPGLPLQIRLTIHEGLSYLALRHVEIGLRRHGDVIRHLDMMTKILPGKHSFQYRAGAYCMEHMVNNPIDAIQYLENAMYGKASTDDEAIESDKYLASRYLISAYCAVGRYEDALPLIINSLEEYPIDFGIYGFLKNMETHIRHTDLYKKAIAQHVFNDVENAYNLVTKYNYLNNSDENSDGFTSKPNANRNPTSLLSIFDTKAPDAIDFYTHVRDRKMFKIDSNSVYDMGTQTSEWWESLPILINKYTDCKQLMNFKGLAEIFVERVPKSSVTDHVKHMGYDMYSSKVMVPYKDYLKRDFCNKNDISGNSHTGQSHTGHANGIIGQHDVTDEFYYYANVQYKDISKDLYYNTYKNHLYRGAYADQQPLFIQNNKDKKKRIRHSIYNSPLHLYTTSNSNDLKNSEKKEEEEHSSDLEIGLKLPPIFHIPSKEFDFNVINNLVDVNLWMGREEVIEHQPTKTISKLHVDSYDNLYVLLRGKKIFITIPPEYGSQLLTIFPTYNMGSNGVSFRTSGNIYIPWKLENRTKDEVEEESEMEVTSEGDEGTITTSISNSNLTSAKIKVKGIVPPVLYPLDNLNAHFSTISDQQLIKHCIANSIPYNIVELTKPGDMFFLPAGVFHQVTSEATENEYYQHVALNYWWKPTQYQNNSKLYEARALGKLREDLLKELL